MKIVVSSDSGDLEGNVDSRFGRCKYFLSIELDGKEISTYEAVENQGAKENHGAGLKAAKQMGILDAEAIITGNIGPNAQSILSDLGIKVYKAEGSLRDAVEKFMNGQLAEMGKEPEPGQRMYIPLDEDKGMDSAICEHFGHAPYFGIYDFDTQELTVTENKLDHSDENDSPVDQVMRSADPSIVFAKGIGQRAIGLFRLRGVKLKTGPYSTVSEVLKNIDELEDLSESCGH